MGTIKGSKCEALTTLPTRSGEDLVVPMQLETLEEVAARLRKSEAQLRWMIHTGTAPRSAKIGGRRLWRASDVDEFINAAFESESA